MKKTYLATLCFLPVLIQVVIASTTTTTDPATETTAMENTMGAMEATTTMEPSTTIYTMEELTTTLQQGTSMSEQSTAMPEQLASVTMSEQSTTMSMSTATIETTPPAESTTASMTSAINATSASAMTEEGSATVEGADMSSMSMMNTSSVLHEMMTSDGSLSSTPSMTSTEGSMSYMQTSMADSMVDSMSNVMDMMNSSMDMIDESSMNTSVIEPSSTQAMEPSSTVTAMPSTTPTTTPTTTPPTTTTLAPNTQTQAIQEGGAILKLGLTLTWNADTNTVADIQQKLDSILKDIPGYEGVLVTINSAPTSRRKKRDAHEPSITVYILLDAASYLSNEKNIGYNITSALTNANVTTSDIAEQIEAFTGTANLACSADVCIAKLAELNGYECTSDGLLCTFTSLCNNYDCGSNGVCYVQTHEDQTTQEAACRCNSESFYYYDGVRCGDKVMKWELALAIAGGVGGALVIILLFVIIGLCAKMKQDSNDISEGSDIMFGEALTKHKAKNFGPGNGSGGLLMSNPSSQMYDNNAYYEDSEGTASSGGNNRPAQEWNPEKSANTYAKIESKLQETNYSMLIKRPQLSPDSRFSGEITSF